MVLRIACEWLDYWDSRTETRRDCGESCEDCAIATIGFGQDRRPVNAVWKGGLRGIVRMDNTKDGRCPVKEGGY